MTRLHWSTLAFIVKTGAQLAVLWASARFLGPEGLGICSFLWLIGGIANTWMEGGMGHVLMAYRALSAPQWWLMAKQQIIWAWGLVFLALLGVLIAFFCHLNPIWLWTAVAMAFALPLQVIGQLPQSLRQREGDFGSMAAIEILAEFLGFLALYALFYLDVGIWAVVARGWVIAFVFGISGWQKLKSWRFAYKTNPLPLPDGPKKMGLLLSLERLLNQLSSGLDRWLVGGFLGISALGIYEMALQMAVRPMGAVGAVLGRLGLPELTALGHDQTALHKAYNQYVQKTAWMALPLYGGVAGLAPLILPFVMGEKFRPAVALFQQFVILGGAWSLVAPQGLLWVALKKPKVSLGLNVVQPIFYAVLLLLGLNQGGLSGIAFWYGGVGAALSIFIDYGLRWRFAQMEILPHLKTWWLPAFVGAILYLLLHFVLEESFF